MTQTLMMYTRTYGCPYVTLAKRVLQQENVPYQEIYIDKDPQARERVIRWTGFLSVPTLVVTENGSSLPAEEPAPLAHGTSPRGIDRGAMITEPSSDELLAWLRKHHFIG